MRVFWFGISVIILALVFWRIFYRDKLIKQIPMAKVMAYLGVGIITYLGLFEKFDTEESLATAIVISAIFEIVTNAQEFLNNLKVKKKEKVKKETKTKGINKTMCVCICAVIIIFIPIVVYSFTAHPVHPSGKNHDWVGFWGGYLGSIIGGVITLFVMWYTLKKTEEENERTARMQLLPFMSYHFVTDKEEVEKNSVGGSWVYLPEYFEFNGDYRACIRIKIKNVGNWHARGIRLYFEIDGSLNDSYESWENSSLMQGEEKEVEFYFVFSDDIAKTNYNFDVRLHIFYQDCLHHTYEQVIKMYVQKSSHYDEEGNMSEVDSVWVGNVEDEKLVSSYPK